MTSDEGDDISTSVSNDPVNFAFLAAQTFGDTDLEAELLDLFLAQGRELIPGLPAREAETRLVLAHRLKGSAKAIGATRLARSLEAYEEAVAKGAAADIAYRDLVASFEATVAAIAAKRARASS